MSRAAQIALLILLSAAAISCTSGSTSDGIDAVAGADSDSDSIDAVAGADPDGDSVEAALVQSDPTETAAYCEVSPRVPADEMLGRLETASPEQLEGGLAEFQESLDEIALHAPRAIADEFSALASVVTDWQQELGSNGWQQGLQEVDASSRDAFLAAYTQISAFTFQLCTGPASRADELEPTTDEMRASQDWQQIATAMRTAGFDTQEAECIATVLQTTKPESLLGAYGYCGIEWERFLALTGS